MLSSVIWIIKAWSWAHITGHYWVHWEHCYWWTDVVCSGDEPHAVVFLYPLGPDSSSLCFRCFQDWLMKFGIVKQRDQRWDEKHILTIDIPTWREAALCHNGLGYSGEDPGGSVISLIPRSCPTAAPSRADWDQHCFLCLQCYCLIVVTVPQKLKGHSERRLNLWFTVAVNSAVLYY